MSNGIKVGDTVRLKSGGPRMTVARVEEWNGAMRAWCQWFGAGDKKEADYFPVTSLQIDAV
jgi:uncharacterized protein YodC (DUF2158 family)